MPGTTLAASPRAASVTGPGRRSDGSLRLLRAQPGVLAAALGIVGVQYDGGRLPTEHRREPPRDLDGIMQTGIHALAADGQGQVPGVAGQEHRARAYPGETPYWKRLWVSHCGSVSVRVSSPVTSGPPPGSRPASDRGPARLRRRPGRTADGSRPRPASRRRSRARSRRTRAGLAPRTAARQLGVDLTVHPDLEPLRHEAQAHLVAHTCFWHHRRRRGSGSAGAPRAIAAAPDRDCHAVNILGDGDDFDSALDPPAASLVFVDQRRLDDVLPAVEDCGCGLVTSSIWIGVVGRAIHEEVHPPGLGKRTPRWRRAGDGGQEFLRPCQRLLAREYARTSVRSSRITQSTPWWQQGHPVVRPTGPAPTTMTSAS